MCGRGRGSDRTLLRLSVLLSLRRLAVLLSLGRLPVLSLLRRSAVLSLTLRCGRRGGSGAGAGDEGGRRSGGSRVATLLTLGRG